MTWPHALEWAFLIAATTLGAVGCVAVGYQSGRDAEQARRDRRRPSCLAPGLFTAGRRIVCDLGDGHPGQHHALVGAPPYPDHMWWGNSVILT